MVTRQFLTSFRIRISFNRNHGFLQKLSTKDQSGQIDPLCLKNQKRSISRVLNTGQETVVDFPPVILNISSFTMIFEGDT